MRKSLSESTGMLGLLVNFIFYIPCLIIDGINYLYGEINLTPRPVLTLFVVEIVLLLIYFMIPYFKSQVMNQNATSLLPGGFYLTSQTTVGNNDMYKMYNVSTGDDNSVYRRNYAFSFWIYVNTQQHKPGMIPGTNETPIFDFDSKPRLSYISNADDTIDMLGDPNINDTFAIHFTNQSQDTEAPIYLLLGKQKWHYIVFNYYSDKADMFVDGNLERSYVFKDRLPSYTPNDVVKIGYDGPSSTGLSGSGLKGAIYNIKYHTENLTQENIARIYNILKFSNPPTD